MPPPPHTVKRIAITLIRTYQCTLSGLLGAHCRFSPTCSQFTIEAIEECGVRRGIWLGVLRILRCHPWHKGGFDPVSAHTGGVDACTEVDSQIDSTLDGGKDAAGQH